MCRAATALFLPAALLLAACDVAPVTAPDAPAAEQASVQLSPGARAVTIGEQGPTLAACGIRGTIAYSDGAVTVRAAPFAEAEERSTAAPGAPVFVCTRSIDQRWLGVVVPPVGDAAADCGVAARGLAQQPYAGPCPSGWVPAATVRLSAG